MAEEKKEKTIKKTSVVKTEKPVMKKPPVKNKTSEAQTKKKELVTKTAVEKEWVTESKEARLTIKVLSIDGTTSGTMTLPSEVFGAKVNSTLMAQAVRVYLANQRSGTSSTKTRGEVTGSTRKIYRQKGTGRARHGSIKAPVFIGGGITFGPRPRDLSLSLPKKMKRSSLFSSLTSQFQGEKVMVVDGFDEMQGKTKELFQMFKAMNLLNKHRKVNKILFVLSGNEEKAKQAARNIEGVTSRHVKDLTTYEVLNSNCIVFVKNSIGVLAEISKK